MTCLTRARAARLPRRFADHVDDEPNKAGPACFAANHPPPILGLTRDPPPLCHGALPSTVSASFSTIVRCMGPLAQPSTPLPSPNYPYAMYMLASAASSSRSSCLFLPRACARSTSSPSPASGFKHNHFTSYYRVTPFAGVRFDSIQPTLKHNFRPHHRSESLKSTCSK